MKYILSLSMLALLFSLNACSKKTVLSGEIDAAQVDVSVKIAGRISKIYVKEGDLVKKGQVLAQLESKELDSKMQTINAAVREAEEQYEFANNSFIRVKNLYETNVLPKQQFDETKYKFNAA